MGDREAFTKFVADEMAVITHGAVKIYNVHVPGAGQKPEEVMPLGDCFYAYIRCNLAHEAVLPDNIAFFPASPGSSTLQLEITPTQMRLSDSWIDGLAKAVHFAPENSDLFPDNASIPSDILPWMLFGERRGGHADYIAVRALRTTRE